jgi:hypothetical protein
MAPAELAEEFAHQLRDLKWQRVAANSNGPIDSSLWTWEDEEGLTWRTILICSGLGDSKLVNVYVGTELVE